MRRQIAVIGGGLTGLTAAYDLICVGHDVTIYEASSATGGLARGFQDENWDWSLEHFYHHLFESDKDLLQLVNELGITDQLFFPRPESSVYYKGTIYPFDSISAFFDFPGFNFWQTLRFGAVTAALRYTRFWRLLERTTADQWMRRWYGRTVYEATWKPLLINKFGRYYDQVPMSWMWARIYARSQKLGYFKGGFQTFADALTHAFFVRGGKIHYQQPVEKIVETNGRITITTSEGHTATYDQCLVTSSPQSLLKLAPAIPALHDTYASKLENLKSIGAVVMVVAMRWPLLKNTYWLNIPATSPDKTANEIPFLALVEHTNYIKNKHYGGDHIVYLGDYVEPDHPYFSMSKEELEELFLSHLSKFNVNFNRDWVRKTWLFRAKYAQPVPLVRHSQNIPDLQTPIPRSLFRQYEPSLSLGSWYQFRRQTRPSCLKTHAIPTRYRTGNR